MIKYRVWYPFGEIKKMECISETEKSIKLNNRRMERKETDNIIYVDTFEEAKTRLIQHISNDIEMNEQRHDNLIKMLDKAIKLTEQ